MDRFVEANQFYRDGKYAEAAKVYEELIKSKPMAEVYYNLANAYFKEKKLGLAILNYERARRLQPRDSDVLANLAYASRLIEYKIEDKRNWYLRKKSELLQFVTLAECWVVALGVYLIFIAYVLISLTLKQQSVFGKAGALLLTLSMLASVPLFLKYGELKTGRMAIVTEGQAEVRYGPSANDRIAFRLVEGFPVSLKDERKDWYRIQLNDGRVGWAAQSQVTPI